MEHELEQIEIWKGKMIEYVASNGMNLLIAALIVFVGTMLSRFVSSFVQALCEKKGVDVTLTKFFGGLSRLLVLTLAVMMALPRAGFEISPIIALLGASAFGLTMALQGPVSNYGAGLALILTRPFKVGDTLNLLGQIGQVQEITLGSTLLLNEDEQRITIPNRKILGEITTNSSAYAIVEARVGIDHACAPEEAITAIKAALPGVPGISEEKPPMVGIDSFGEYSINIGYRYWVTTRTYHTSRYAANMAVYKALKAADIAIAIPRRDIRMLTGSEN